MRTKTIIEENAIAENLIKWVGLRIGDRFKDENGVEFKVINLMTGPRAWRLGPEWIMYTRDLDAVIFSAKGSIIYNPAHRPKNILCPDGILLF